MNDPFVTLLQFFVATGEVLGRKKCQKMVHILQECGYPFGFHFKLALYGAFSSELQGRVESIVEDGYIAEEPSSTQGSGFPTSRFSATPRSSEILDLLDESSETVWASLARELNELPTRKLEAISTILYLRRNGTSEDRLQDKFKILKPHLEGIYVKAKGKADELVSESTQAA